MSSVKKRLSDHIVDIAKVSLCIVCIPIALCAILAFLVLARDQERHGGFESGDDYE